MTGIQNNFQFSCNSTYSPELNSCGKTNLLISFATRIIWNGNVQAVYSGILSNTVHESMQSFRETH
jgi:hypothetical protein